MDLSYIGRAQAKCRCFRSVTRSYYRGAAGAILVYDITKSVPLSVVVQRHSYPPIVGVLSSTYLGGYRMLEPLRVQTLSSFSSGISQIERRIGKSTGPRLVGGQRRTVRPSSYSDGPVWFTLSCHRRALSGSFLVNRGEC